MTNKPPNEDMRTLSDDVDRFFEDLRVGEIWTDEPVVLTEPEIVAFAQAYDPQPFHTDPEAASRLFFGTLVASGWHVLAAVMRTFVDAKPLGTTPMVGLGIEDLRWLVPVRPGDRLQARRTITELAPFRSRPGGRVRTHVTVENQLGTEVLHFDVLMMIPTRPNSRAPASP